MILTDVRGSLAYPLSDRNLEARRTEPGVEVDYSRVYRGVQKLTPQREATFRNGKKRPVSTRGRLDETSIKSQGPWKSLDRAVDREVQILDVLLMAHRDLKAARRCFKKAIRPPGSRRRTPSTTVEPTRRPLMRSRRP